MQLTGCMREVPVAHPGYRVLSDILFRLGLIANALTQCSSQTVATLQSLSPVLARYDPFGVDVPLKCDIIIIIIINQTVYNCLSNANHLTLLLINDI